jgi:hypothetical protein
MTVQNLSIDHYLSLIKDNKPFSFSRFGDGEVLTMFNADFFKGPNWHYGDWVFKCGEDLKRIFQNGYDYYHCMLYGTFWSHGPHTGEEFKQFLIETCPNLSLYNGEIWADASTDDNIEQITTAISNYNPVFIGGKHLKNIRHINGICDMSLIVVDDLNAYDQIDFVKSEIIKKIENGNRMFCFSAAVASKVIIDDLFPIYGDKCFFIDFGSVWDPYCGKLSRSGMVLKGFDYFQKYTSYKLF